MSSNASDPRTSLGELAGLFLRIGATAFGGPASHIAFMQHEVVRRRGWLTETEFLDLLSASYLLPGPSSTELALHIGWTRRGLLGLLVAGLCFISPATIASAFLAWLYLRYGGLPQAGWLLAGVRPILVAVVVQALIGLVPKAARTNGLRMIGLGAVVFSFVGAPELGVLLAAGLAAVALAWPGRTHLALPPLLLPGFTLVGTLSPASLFWVFLKIGSVLFGSGYVLIAFLRADLVERLHWLSEAQLVDAVSVGQVTPGPVFSTATFIGWFLRGPAGAAAATIGVFLPAFLFVVVSGPLVPRLRASRTASAFLDGVNVGSAALMLIVTVQLARAAIVDLPTGALAVVAAGLLFRLRWNPTWLVLGGALLGLARHLW